MIVVKLTIFDVMTGKPFYEAYVNQELMPSLKQETIIFVQRWNKF